MPRKKTQQEELPQDIELLDNLIVKCYRELNKAKSLHAKIGDFVKMMNLRYKLNPASASQKRLWQMLDDIRRNGLASEKSAKQAAPASKPAQSKSKGRGKS